MRDQLADFTALAQAIVAARQAADAMDHDHEAHAAMVAAFTALARPLCKAAYALAEAIPPPEGPQPDDPVELVREGPTACR